MTIKGQHRGHCQACGRVHVTDGLLAKHGYRVAGFGYFNNVCFGSNHKPLEQERKLTDEIIADLRAQAQRQDVRAIALRGGALKPERAAKRGSYNSKVYATLHGESAPIMLDWASASQHERELQVEEDASSAESWARFARSHAASLSDLADRVHGTQLIDRTQLELERQAIAEAKTQPIEGAYRSKAEQKRDLEKLSRAFSEIAQDIEDTYLEKRDEPGKELYFSIPHELHQWRTAHSLQVLAVYPEHRPQVEEIEALISRRAVIKAKPVIK